MAPASELVGHVGPGAAHTLGRRIVDRVVAMLINDGDGGNDELAMDISEALNESQMLDIGVIPEDIADIAAYFASLEGVE